LNQKKYNFLQNLNRADFHNFRNRFTGMILATDMSRGHEDLVMLNSLIEDHNVINGMNAEELIDTSSKVNQFKSQ
jgi:hypothetical protein